MLGLALVLACTIPGDQPVEVDLSFRTTNLVGWEGNGFEAISEEGKAISSTSMRASSQNAPRDGRALLHAAIKIPSTVKEIHCFAAAIRSEPGKPDEELDVLMYASGKRLIPKRVRTEHGWGPVDKLLGPKKDQLQEYCWNVEAYAGKTVRLALLDDDPRPDCYLICSGFQMLTDDRTLDRAFEIEVHQFERAHHLKPMIRFESQHYLAMSNADSSFSEFRLGNCEVLYTNFFQHFRGKGFKVQEPSGKLHAVVFQSQASFQDYAELKLSPFVTGIYAFKTNRLVMYDFGSNKEFIASKRKAEEKGQQIHGIDDRQRYLDSISRQSDEFRRGHNISTIMHEAAHQLSFNCGLLNRSADTPIWLAEGLACYCEATKQGVWLGIGEPNPERLGALKKALDSKAGLLPLTTILTGDKWISVKGEEASVLQGYGQSWALFRWLMETQPIKMADYLKTPLKRSTPEHRLADFQHAFGRDLRAVQKQYEEYIKGLVKRYHSDRLQSRRTPHRSILAVMHAHGRPRWRLRTDLSFAIQFNHLFWVMLATRCRHWANAWHGRRRDGIARESCRRHQFLHLPFLKRATESGLGQHLTLPAPKSLPRWTGG